MEDSQTHEIIVDADRRDECINAMANCLASVMTLKDPELSRDVAWEQSNSIFMNKTMLSKAREAYWKMDDVYRSRCLPFGTLLHEEFSIKATKDQEERLEIIYNMSKFTQTTFDHSSSMADESDESYEGDFYYDSGQSDDEAGGEEASEWKRKIRSAEFQNNIDLWYYAYSLPNNPFFIKCNYVAFNGSQIQVGGIARSLCDEFERLAKDWLHKCDKIFCQSNDIPCEKNERMDEYVSNMSKAIARRHSLMRHPKDKIDHKKDVDSVIELECLECQAAYEFWDNNQQADRDRRLDTASLLSLLIIAKQGGHTTEAREVILKHTPNIQRAIENPPQELGMHIEKRIKKFNFSALRKLLNASIENPFLCRCECAQAWHENHGEWAAVEIQSALDWINREDIRAGTRYLELVGTERQKESLDLPPNPCAYEDLSWFAYKPVHTKRSRLSQIGLRIVCMATFVRKRVEADTLKFGTSHKQIVHNVAIDHMHKATYASLRLDADRLQTNQGVSLLMFEKNLHNPSSEVSALLDNSLCYLSGFSYAELNGLFGNRASFDKIRHDLSSKTRHLVSNEVVPSEYVRFTDDALSILMTSICQRRESHGLKSYVKTNALLDLVRCIPRFRKWRVQEPEKRGFLILTLEDLEYSHKSLRSIIEHLSRTTSDLLWIEQKNHDKMHFVFDDSRLDLFLHDEMVLKGV